jgi:hypothetical protein
MTNPLANLIARVTGQAAPRLRPRIASRFERGAMAGDGFQEVAGERIVRAPETPSPSIAPRPPQQPAPAAETIATQQGNTAAPVGQQETIVQTSVQVEREVSAAPARSPETAAPPPPLMPEVTSSPESHDETAREPALSASRVEPEQGPLSLQPPEPLLPPEPLMAEQGRQPAMPDSEAFAALSAPQPSRQPPPAASAAPNEPPEIVINIGRIDLRTPPAAPQAPRPRQQRPKTTDLGDYLRSKGGKR